MVEHIGSLSGFASLFDVVGLCVLRLLAIPTDNSSERKIPLLIASLYLLGIEVRYCKKVLSPVNHVAVRIVA